MGDPWGAAGYSRAGRGGRWGFYERGVDTMAEIVRAALVQQRWTGDKESMIQAAVGHIATAASAGAQVVCLEELFYGPYFCQVQDADYYGYTEPIPDGAKPRPMQ